MPYCSRCGTEYPLEREKCSNCGADLPRRPEHSALKADPDKPFQNARGRRFIAGIIDLAIAVILVVLLAVVLSRRWIIFRWLLARIGLVLLLPNPYLLLKDSIEGKSVGKLIMGLVVYNEKDKRAGGVLDSIIRNWYLAIPLLGPTLLALVIGVFILAGRRKRLGDDWANTTVITDLEYQQLR